MAAAAADDASCSNENAQSTSASLTGKNQGATSWKLSPALQTAAVAGAGSSRARKVQQKSQSSSSIRLDRIESGVNQIIALLVREQTERRSDVPAANKMSAAEVVQNADSLTDSDHEGPLSRAAIASACLPSSRRASRNNLGHDCPGCDDPEAVSAAAAAAAMWRGRSADLQATVDMLASRLASQAALLDARMEEARREREEATDERLELLRRLGSFRRQLDASQAARARLYAALESTKAELSRLKQQGGGGGGSQDLEETVVALTTQLDLSNQQLMDMEHSRDSLRRRAEQLQALLRSGGAGDGGGLVRSCSCDQRLHECCRRGDGLGKGSPPQPPPQSRQAVSDHGGNVSEPSGGSADRPSSSSKKSLRKRLLRRKKSKIEESDD